MSFPSTIRSRRRQTASRMRRPEYRRRRTNARSLARLSMPNEFFVGYFSTAARILSNSSPVKGSVGFWWNFGGFSVPTGFSSTHFMPAQKRKKDRSRSSFFRAEIGESFQPARNLTMLSPVSCEMCFTPISLAKAVSRDRRTFCLPTVASVKGRVRAPALPGAEEVLAGLPRTHVQGPANLLAAERSLDPERALAAPVFPAFGSMAAVGEMPPVEGQHRNSIARITHTAILSALSY